MRKPLLLDWGRRLLIVLLLVSAVLLLRRTGYYAGVREKLRASAAERTESTTNESGAQLRPNVTVRPLAAVVCPQENGARYGAAWDEAVTAVLRRFSAELGEALGSAGTPVEIDEAAYRERLDRCGVFFRFCCPQPLELLSVWLGAEMSGAAAAHQAETLCLCISDAEVELCYRTAERTCYACSTAVQADGFRSRAAEFSPNGAQYAWESERFEGGDDSVLLSAAPTAAAVGSAAVLPGDDEIDVLLQAMGMNSFVTSSYTEADGTTVYVHEETTLRVSPSGAAFFRRAASPEAEEARDLAASAGRAWLAAERSIEAACGDGALLFAGASYQESQRTTTILLDYIIDGIPVRLADGHAAESVLRGDTIIQARLQFRRFTRGEARTELLPYLQAAAVAAAEGGRPELVYADSGEATECVWVIADE